MTLEEKLKDDREEGLERDRQKFKRFTYIDPEI